MKILSNKNGYSHYLYNAKTSVLGSRFPITRTVELVDCVVNMLNGAIRVITGLTGSENLELLVCCLNPHASNSIVKNSTNAALTFNPKFDHVSSNLVVILDCIKA